MLFNSYEFIFLFLPLAVGVYFLLGKISANASKFWLVLASLGFYTYWKPEFLPVLLFSLFFNFWIGKQLVKGNSKSLLILGIVVNLALLGVFKYTDFLLANLNYFRPDDPIPYTKWILPLAISFFTFQQIAYLVDSHKGVTRESSFLNYALFVTFFPQLIAGPIVHHLEMMPQFARKWVHQVNWDNVVKGSYIFTIGLAKKVLIADNFARLATVGFDQLPVLTFEDAWVSSLSYTLQLYFDFSGYTDMAIGLACVFNIRLPFNFNSPYRALDIQDFWKRWHMTLSRFLRDYLYIPLGGNRGGQWLTYRNLFLTFLLGGIWHGAGWTFIIWGTLHGIATVIHRIWKKRGFNLAKPLAWLVTFLFAHVAWVFFRAETVQDALKVFKGMVGKNGMGFSWQLSHANGFPIDPGLCIVLAIAFIWVVPNTNKLIDQFRPTWWRLTWQITAFTVVLLSLNKISEFIYFGF